MSTDLFFRVNQHRPTTTKMSNKLKSIFKSLYSSLRDNLAKIIKFTIALYKKFELKVSQSMTRWGANTTTTVTTIPITDIDTVPSSSRCAFWQKIWAKEKKLLFLVVCLALSCMVLFCGVISLAVVMGNESQPKVCKSKACVASAAMLMENIDPRVDPCDDFYSFACGRWPHHHPIPDSSQNIDWFIEKKISVKREIRDVLEKSVPSIYEPDAVKQMRTLYADCLNTETINAKRLEPLRTLLKQLSLSLRPALFEDGERGKPHPNFSVPIIAAVAKRTAGFDVLISATVYPDPLNNSHNLLGLASPSWRSSLPGEIHQSIEWRLPLPQTFKRQFYTYPVNPPKQVKSKEVLLRQKYMSNMIKTILELGLEDELNNTNPTKEVAPLDDAVSKIYDFEGKLYKLANFSISDVDYSLMTFEDLQNMTDTHSDNKEQNKIIWQEYFTQLFQDTNITTSDIPSAHIQMSFLQNLAQLLSETSPALVEATIWWQVVDATVPYLMQSVKAVRRAYIEEITSGQSVMSRSMVCASITNDLMGMAVSYLFATPSFVQAAQEKVGEMVDDIRESFIERVHKLDWMDEETRLVTLKKVNAMKALIAFPKWMLKSGELDKYYNGVKLEPGNYLMNALKIMKASMNKMLMSVVLPNTFKMETWASDPTDVNAYYSFQDNAITIPAAILQYPFYNMGLEVLNYGAIGTILGHELTHGFDTLGRLYDDVGNFRPWWTNKTTKEYMRRSSCFIYQYSKYRINDVHSNVDGYTTLGENIADNGGIHEAVEAYKKLSARHGHSLDNILPGLESLKPDQLLYLSYANLWCEQSTPMAKRWSVKGNHAPNPARIWGSLSNSKHFAKTWNCPLHSPMNPQNKCELW